MKLAILGLGYVGSVTAACLANEGHEVVGVDPDHVKVQQINRAESPVVEPGLVEMIERSLAAGTLRAVTDPTTVIAASEVSIVCVGTPSRSNGSLSFDYVDAVVDQIGAALRDRDGFHTVVIRSTVLPGTVEGRVIERLEAASAKRVDVDFGVAMCPEFLRETTAIDDFYHPPFTVLGVRDPRSEAALTELFAFLPGAPRCVPISTAEALKYACNAFHAVKISFANEMGRLCRTSGVDAAQVMDLLCQDQQLNISPAYLKPGFAFGGSCLPKDLRALMYQAKTADVDIPMIGNVLASNESHLRQAVRAVLASDARKVCLLGLSFKVGTDDLRESPYVELAETLIGKGIEVSIYDREVRPARMIGANLRFMRERLPHLAQILHDDPVTALAGVEGAVVATKEPRVIDALTAAPPRLVLDLTGELRRAADQLPGLVSLVW